MSFDKPPVLPVPLAAGIYWTGLLIRVVLTGANCDDADSGPRDGLMNVQKPSTGSLFLLWFMLWGVAKCVLPGV